MQSGKRRLKMTKEICHVCKKEKKPYIVILTDDIFSLIHYEQAREKGKICQRCDQYFAMTGEFKDATDEEFELAKKASHFAYTFGKWWEKDKPHSVDDDDYRKWEGTVNLVKWYRKEFVIHAVRETEDKK